MSTFGWGYPPGVTGNETHLTGMWQCVECNRTIGDGHGCCERCDTPECAADHCDGCCTNDDQPQGENDNG